jgi:FlaA1/EpsC-like NDP-sugar epimerase
MIKPEALAARLVDVVLVVSGAAIASQIRFDDIGQRNIYYAFVAFSAAFALALFPAFGVYQSWRGRSKMGLIGQVSLAWLTVQTCALVLMFTLHRSDFVSRLWFAYWTGTTGALMIVSRVLVHRVLARVRRNWSARSTAARRRVFARRRCWTWRMTGRR